MVYFFSKKGKSNSLALIDYVNAFAFLFCFVLFFFSGEQEFLS